MKLQVISAVYRSDEHSYQVRQGSRTYKVSASLLPGAAKAGARELFGEEVAAVEYVSGDRHNGGRYQALNSAGQRLGEPFEVQFVGEAL